MPAYQRAFCTFNFTFFQVNFFCRFYYDDNDNVGKKYKVAIRGVRVINNARIVQLGCIVIQILTTKLGKFFYVLVTHKKSLPILLCNLGAGCERGGRCISDYHFFFYFLRGPTLKPWQIFVVSFLSYFPLPFFFKMTKRMRFIIISQTFLLLFLVCTF